MKKIKILAVLSLLAVATLFNSCTDEEKFPVPFNFTDGEIPGNLERGAFLKTLSSRFVVDFFDLRNSQLSITLEEHDSLSLTGQTLIEDVDVFVSFRDRTFDDNDTPDDTSDDIGNDSKAEASFAQIPLSSFSVNSAGYYETSYIANVGEMMDLLGLAEADINPSDIFDVRFALNLTTGDTFSVSNTNINIGGEDYFSSPFTYAGTVVCPVPEDFFVGTYQVETTSNGVFGPVFDGVVEVTLDDSSPVVRRFDGDWINFGNLVNYSFSLVCGDIIWDDEQSTGLACGGGAAITLDTPNVFTQYDTTFQDDNVILINISEQSTSCGGPAALLTQVRFTKL